MKLKDIRFFPLYDAELGTWTRHPVVEAPFDTAFTVYKSDKRKAIIGDPFNCIAALGMRRMHKVKFAYITSGRDAYVGYEDEDSPTGITVRHFIVTAETAKIRDLFDSKGSPETKLIMLKAPNEFQKLAYRSVRDKKRRAAVKNGAPVKKRGPQKVKRIDRLGIVPRPRARIENGEVIVQSIEHSFL
jgi:hypothetical protein